MLTYVRDLNTSDREELENPAPQIKIRGYASSGMGLQRIRHTHHLLAMVLAEGATAQRASMLTGYAPTTIAMLQSEPKFKDLIEHYRSACMAEYEELKRRAASLGLSFLDELQQRFEDDPEDFSKKELMDYSTKLLDRTILPSKNAEAPPPPRAQGTPPIMRIEFVESSSPRESIPQGRTIELAAIEISNKE